MAAREFSTIFHARGMFRKKIWEEIGWRQEDFSDFRKNLEDGMYKPESLFLDLFVNSLTAEPTYPNIVWWREQAPRLARSEWFLAALGYAQAMRTKSANDILLVDFWEREIESDNFIEALAISAELAAREQIRLHWICWSNTILENWQQESMGAAEAAEERLDDFFRAQGLNPIFVPVTDPLGAALAAKKLAAQAGRKTILVLPSFGNDKLVHANWSMKTIAKYSSAMEALE